MIDQIELDRLADEITMQKLLIRNLSIHNTFTNPEAYLAQAKRYNEAIEKLNLLEKDYQNATRT